MNVVRFVPGDFSEVYFRMLEHCLHSPTLYSDSRVGKVKDLGPALFEMGAKHSRLALLVDRAINPFFALAEFSWAITGSNSLAPLEHFVSSYREYSDDGATLNGAYGFRLRHYFGVDQIERAIDLLRSDPRTRRAVLQIWSADDLSKASRDLPCNTSLYLKIRDNQLQMTVLNRSNDVFLGVPYNVLLFHLLQLHIASQLGYPPGRQIHYADSLHLYERNIEAVETIVNSTNPDLLSLPEAVLPRFDLGSYIPIKHASVLDLRFADIHDKSIRDLFLAFSRHKQGSTQEALTLLPRNPLGFMAYQWFKRRKKIFSDNLMIREFEDIVQAQLKRNDKLTIRAAKYKAPEELRSTIIRLVEKYAERAETFVSVLCANKSLFSIKADDSSKVLHAVFLAIMLADIGTIVDSSLRWRLVRKTRMLCEELGLNFNDLLHLTLYEREFLRLIE